MTRKRYINLTTWAKSGDKENWRVPRRLYVPTVRMLLNDRRVWAFAIEGKAAAEHLTDYGDRGITVWDPVGGGGILVPGADLEPRAWDHLNGGAETAEAMLAEA